MSSLPSAANPLGTELSKEEEATLREAGILILVPEKLAVYERPPPL